VVVKSAVLAEMRCVGSSRQAVAALATSLVFTVLTAAAFALGAEPGGPSGLPGTPPTPAFSVSRWVESNQPLTSLCTFLVLGGMAIALLYGSVLADGTDLARQASAGRPILGVLPAAIAQSIAWFGWAVLTAACVVAASALGAMVRGIDAVSGLDPGPFLETASRVLLPGTVLVAGATVLGWLCRPRPGSAIAASALWFMVGGFLVASAVAIQQRLRYPNWVLYGFSGGPVAWVLSGSPPLDFAHIDQGPLWAASAVWLSLSAILVGAVVATRRRGITHGS
jgi:hypothetical protein